MFFKFYESVAKVKTILQLDNLNADLIMIVNFLHEIWLNIYLIGIHFSHL